MNRTLLWCAAAVAVLCVAEACNSAICGPRVSKCLLIKCCDCDMSDKSNCTCCRDCALCLTKLYTDCCSCVGLCPEPDPNDSLAKSSTVEDLPDPIPSLFRALTGEDDKEFRWSTFTYEVDLDKIVLEDNDANPKTKSGVLDVKILRTDKGDTANKEPSYNQEPLSYSKEPVLGKKNCTVAFFSDCLSMSKCKASCTSMGASKYRWFHQHGCCQCVGNTCFDYGLGQPHCLHCPEQADMAYEEDLLFNPYVKKSQISTARDSF